MYCERSQDEMLKDAAQRKVFGFNLARHTSKAESLGIKRGFGSWQGVQTFYSTRSSVR